MYYSTVVAAIYFVILYWCFRGSLCLFFLFLFLRDWWVLLLHYFQNWVCGLLMLWNILPCRWLEFCQGCFSYWLFFYLVRWWSEYGDFQSKSPYSLRMWRNASQTNPECEYFSGSSRLEHCFVILIPLHYNLTAISWLNDCEDMNLIVPTQLVVSLISEYIYIYIYIYKN